MQRLDQTPDFSPAKPPRSIPRRRRSSQKRETPAEPRNEARVETVPTLMLPALATLLFAPPALVGVWKGRLVVSAPPPRPFAMEPLAVRLGRERDLSNLLAARPTLTLGKDGMYTLKNDGVPQLGPGDSKGKWFHKGSLVRLVPKGTKRTYPFNLDGKERELTATSAYGETEIRFTFTRG